MIGLNLIVCATKSNGIGVAGRLPWRLREDMKFFKHVTSLAPPNRKNVVIMGRKTWESIPLKFRPLADRINIIVSGKTDAASLGIDEKQHSYVVNSIQSACQLIEKINDDAKEKVNKVFVIGGAQIYRAILDKNLQEKLFKASNILLTRILSDHESIEKSIDTYFPEFRLDPNWSKSHDSKHQNNFLNIDSTGPHEVSQFSFDQLVTEDQFTYTFELWVNNVS